MDTKTMTQGTLLKFTNVMKGFQPRWFQIDLKSGNLEYYEKEGTRTKPRGAISLINANIIPNFEDSLTFNVNAANGDLFKLKANNTRERTNWIDSLRNAIEYVRENPPPTPQLPLNFSMIHPLTGSIASLSQPHPFDQNIANWGITAEFDSPSRTSNSRASNRPKNERESSLTAYTVAASNDPLNNVISLLSQMDLELKMLSIDIDTLPKTAAFDKSLLLSKALTAASINSLKKGLSAIRNRTNLQLAFSSSASTTSAATANHSAAAAAGGGGSGSARISATANAANPGNSDNQTGCIASSIASSSAVKKDQQLLSSDTSTPKEETAEAEVSAANQNSSPHGGSKSPATIPKAGNNTNNTTSMISNGSEFKRHNNSKSVENGEHHKNGGERESDGEAEREAGSTSGNELANQIPSPIQGMINWRQRVAQQLDDGHDQHHKEKENMILQEGKEDVEKEEEEVMDASEDEEADLGCVEKHKPVILHIVSQLKLGMDLTKVTLPSFILEKRSLLEMFADFMGHPYLFLRIPAASTPEARMLRVLEWYLTALHTGRKGSIAKKPYNSIIGETFECSWRLSEAELEERLPPNQFLSTSSSLNSASYSSAKSTPLKIRYFAEQVSHHPPITAFHCECAEKRIRLSSSIHTLSKYRGMTISAQMIGSMNLSLRRRRNGSDRGDAEEVKEATENDDNDEEEETYQISLPTTYARSILSTPWVELGDKISIVCAQTRYSAGVTFHTKPFYGGKEHRITAELKGPDGLALVRVAGDWTDAFDFEHLSTGEKSCVKVRDLPVHKKWVRRLEAQRPEESRRLWSQVTQHLRRGNLQEATAAKQHLEMVQRQSEQIRLAHGIAFPSQFFRAIAPPPQTNQPHLRASTVNGGSAAHPSNSNSNSSNPNSPFKSSAASSVTQLKWQFKQKLRNY